MSNILWCRVTLQADGKYQFSAGVPDAFTETPPYPADFIYRPVVRWLAPYIDPSYWWDDETQRFVDASGYQYWLYRAVADTKQRFFQAQQEANAIAIPALVDAVVALSVGSPVPQEHAKKLQDITTVYAENTERLAFLSELTLPATITDDSMEDLLVTIRSTVPVRYTV